MGYKECFWFLITPTSPYKPEKCLIHPKLRHKWKYIPSHSTSITSTALLCILNLGLELIIAACLKLNIERKPSRIECPLSDHSSSREKMVLPILQAKSQSRQSRNGHRDSDLLKQLTLASRSLLFPTYSVPGAITCYLEDSILVFWIDPSLPWSKQPIIGADSAGPRFDPPPCQRLHPCLKGTIPLADK